MRGLFLAAIAAAAVGASSAATAEGAVFMPAFRYPDVAGRQAVYGPPEAPLFWEGPDRPHGR